MTKILTLVFGFLLSICFFSCDPKQTSTTPPIILKEIALDTENLDPTRTDLSAWIFAFTITNDGNGFSDRVHLYSSKNNLIADTKTQLAKMKQIQKGHDYVAQIIAERAAKIVDFSKEDLVVVNLSTGGPPFGTYGYTFKDKDITFCITPPNNPSGISGMALQTITKYYAVPKGFSVKKCK